MLDQEYADTQINHQKADLWQLNVSLTHELIEAFLSCFIAGPKCGQYSICQSCAIFRNHITVQFLDAVLFGRVQGIYVPKKLIENENDGEFWLRNHISSSNEITAELKTMWSWKSLSEKIQSQEKNSIKTVLFPAAGVVPSKVPLLYPQCVSFIWKHGYSEALKII